MFKEILEIQIDIIIFIYKLTTTHFLTYFVATMDLLDLLHDLHPIPLWLPASLPISASDYRMIRDVRRHFTDNDRTKTEMASTCTIWGHGLITVNYPSLEDTKSNLACNFTASSGLGIRGVFFMGEEQCHFPQHIQNQR